MAAGFKGDVESRAAGQRSGLAKREDFCMGLAGCVVIPLADDAVLVNDDSSDHRIGAGFTKALHRKVKGLTHVVQIVWLNRSRST